MALPQQRQMLQDTEVRCDKEGGAVTVRISDAHHHQQVGPDQNSQRTGVPSGKHCKYSISSSCSSVGPKAITTHLRSQRRVPPLFERSAAQCWDPKFDSPILEEACRERCFLQLQRRLRYVLFYLATAAFLWGVYFGINSNRCDPASFLVPTAVVFTLSLLFLWFTFSRLYVRFYHHTSFLLTVIMFGFTLAPQMQTSLFAHFGERGELNQSLPAPTGEFSQPAPCISPVGTFSLCMEVLLLLYSVLHLRLYASVLLGLLYSVLYEALGWLQLTQVETSDGQSSNWDILTWLGPGKVLLHLCAHVIGIHIFIMSEVRSRSTFLKVGQAIMHGKDLEVEKALKERMIHSVMPRVVADELMKQGDEESESSGKRYSAGNTAVTSSSPKNNKRKKNSIPRGQIIFRPFNMQRMEPVSILFADIVGFTKMSANKSAHALVGLLNDLFGRFDRLCELTRCEKISTLGDCYYCVAGCPEPRTDHAYCCVEMGLGMIQAIEQFCQETSETVDMRVGVHTGTVLCGILGIKRFKFDVWSNDVNLANLMEQLGVAGKVHLSEVTASFLNDRYEREDGRVVERVGHGFTEQLKGLKTYLISGRKMGSQCGCSQVSLGRDLAEMLSPSPQIDTPDLKRSTIAEPLLHNKACGVSLDVGVNLADDAARNGCQDERWPNSSKFPASPKTLNGLLSPLCEEGVRVSQSSLCDILQDKDRNWVTSLAAEGSGVERSAILPLRSKNLREKSDAHFVEVIKEDSLMKDYFFKPPINKLSLKFLDPTLESAYCTSYQEEVVNHLPVQTFASPVFSSLLDVLLSCAVFLALTVACFLYPIVSMEMPLAIPLGVAIAAAVLKLVTLVLSVRMTFCQHNAHSCMHSLLKFVSGWLPRHVIGAVLVSLPAVSVFSHLSYCLQLPIQVTVFLCCALIIAIIQYCNFCQLSFWMRSALATVVGLSLLARLYGATIRPSTTDSFTSVGNMSNSSLGLDLTPTALDLLVPETLLSFFLLLLLVWFLNREFEVSYRLHYHGNVEADKHRIKIRTLRDQADWLLRNIIPIHVAEQLKVNQSYSKNHDNVGVIFASIVNFSEFYEESYEGGKECYRVLNELIGDFDDLLRKPAFSNVEKIKTIGATYMAASGLNGQQCQEQAHPNAHLPALFEFALEMMRVMDDFNKNMLGFKFKLRIGFNHGPLTAGVIGTTKLLYDIWGDTVNIASRMDSTGVECRIQVSEESHCVLSRMNYAFDYRGTVNVKGKGQMRTYLYPQLNESRTESTQSLELQGQVDKAIGHFELIAPGNTTTPAPLNPPKTSPNIASISGHDVPQGHVLGPSQINKEKPQDTKDNFLVSEFHEDFKGSYQASLLSGTQPPSIAQLYTPETPVQEEEREETDESTKLRAVK